MFLGLITGASALLTNHWHILELPGGMHSIVYSLIILASFIGAALFFILTINHLRIRGRVYKRLDQTALKLLGVIVALEALNLYIFTPREQSHNCLEFILLQMSVLVVFPLIIWRYRDVSHKVIASRQAFYTLFFTTILVLRLTCHALDPQHVILSHAIPVGAFLILVRISHPLLNKFFKQI